jgi:hypothetical protein
MVRWVYPAERDWLACDRCHAAIQADDRQALLERVMLQPIPRTLSDRHANRFRARAKQLHDEFWQSRAAGHPEPVRP